MVRSIRTTFYEFLCHMEILELNVVEAGYQMLCIYFFRNHFLVPTRIPRYFFHALDANKV